MAEEILNQYISEKGIIKIIINYKKQLEKKARKKIKKKIKKNNKKKKRAERKLLRLHKINMNFSI